MNKSQNKSPALDTRAKRYARVIQLLFAKQQLTGKLSNVNRGARHLSFGVRLADPLNLDVALKMAEPLALHCGVSAVLAQRLEGVISYQVQLPEMYWQYFTRQDLTVPQAIGLAEQRRPVIFQLDPPHCLVAGASQTSGKSTTVQSMLVSLMSTFSPDDLSIILCDPHGDYSDFANEAHLVRFDFGSIAREAQDIETALNWADQTLTYRKTEDIKNAKTIIVVIDEAESVLTGDNLRIAQNLARQSAKYRMHLLIATQEPNQTKLPGIVGNCLNRYVGQLADAKLSATISGHSGLMAHRLTPRGDFIHIAGPLSERFQVAQPTRRDFDQLDRCELAPVNAPSVEVIELPGDLKAAGPGRPAYQVNPQYLAWYFFHHPNKISRSMARELLGLGQRGHELHRDFCREFIKAYLELRQSNQKQIGV